MSASSEIKLEKAALVHYDSGFIVTAIEPVEKQGQWGPYVSQYAVRMKSANPTNPKTYTVLLGKDDPTLGSLLWVWNEAAYKGVVFSRGADGTSVIASMKKGPE